MSRIVPDREVHRVPSEKYRPHAEAVVRVEMPTDQRVQRGIQTVLLNAFDDGRAWRFAGKKKYADLVDVPEWCWESWVAGYDSADREIAAHAEAVASTTMDATKGPGALTG